MSENKEVSLDEDGLAIINVEFGEADLEPYTKQYAKEKQKSVVIRGYRKGKAPVEMVARYFKDEARQAAKNSLAYSKCLKLLQDHKLQMLTDLKLNEATDKDGQVAMKFEVEVLSPIVLNQYMGLDVKKLPERTEDPLEDVMAMIRNTYKKTTLVEAPVALGREVVVDFVMSDDTGKLIEKQNDFRIVIGNGSIFADFETAITDCVAGDNKSFTLTFPDTYNNEKLKSKTVEFVVNVKAVYDVSEYTDEELAALLNYESTEQMAAKLTEEVSAKYKEEDRQYYENQILDQLFASHQFKIPKTLLAREVAKMKAERTDLAASDIEVLAEKFVRTDLILNAIYEHHPADLEIKQEEFAAKINELAARANLSVGEMVNRLETSGKMTSYAGYLRNMKVVSFLIETSNMVEQETIITEENKGE